MGSSALGATRFKARLMKAGLPGIKCTNCAVGEIPADASLVVCQKELESRARLSGKEVLGITNFLSDPALDALLEACKAGTMPSVPAEAVDAPVAAAPELLRPENILTGLAPESKEAAIRRAGVLLQVSGCVDAGYIEAMLDREKVASTYMGEGLAIPHGTAEGKASVRRSGIVVLQYPEGVDFDGEKARLLVGIAGVGDEHLSLLAKVAGALEDPGVLERLCSTSDPSEIYNTLK